MAMLSKLHGRFRVDAIRPPATEVAIAELLSFSSTIIPVPGDYLELVREGTEVEILVDNRGYVRFWGPSHCVEINGAYRIQESMPHALAIGDNEGGDAIVWMDGEHGLGLYLVDFAVLTVTSAVYVGASIQSYLVNGVGRSIGT